LLSFNIDMDVGWTNGMWYLGSPPKWAQNPDFKGYCHLLEVIRSDAAQSVHVTSS